jgi:hypothetical protein
MFISRLCFTELKLYMHFQLPLNIEVFLELYVEVPITFVQYFHVSGVPRLIITSSGLDDLVYWHFFTIIINCNSSRSVTVRDSLHSLLDYACLLFYCD